MYLDALLYYSDYFTKWVAADTFWVTGFSRAAGCATVLARSEASNTVSLPK